MALRDKEGIMAERQRCKWGAKGLMLDYHDKEWGVPKRDDTTLFEFLVLEGAQAGLSWSTILNKRERYREVFDGFVVEKVAAYGEEKVAELLADAGIIRNRLKVNSAIRNARAVLRIAEEEGSFAEWIWGFVGGEPIQNGRKSMAEVPASTPESDAMAKELKRRGCNFVGTTICYAYMQAVGMVNDHEVGCFRYLELGGA